MDRIYGVDMQMALPPADQKLTLDFVSSQYHSPLEGSIDLISIPDMVGSVSMEDDDNSHIEDIPGVRSLGIKRDYLNFHTAPSKLQRITPIATKNALLQVAKTLEFSTAENPIAPSVTGKAKMCVSIEEKKREALMAISNLSDRASIGKTDKLKDIARVTELDTLVNLYRSLKEEVAGHLEEIKVLQEKTSAKDGQITKLRKDLSNVNTEKEMLIKMHSKEIEDLTTSFRIERAELDGQITKLRKDLSNVNTEKEMLIKMHSKEIEDLTTSFRIEKAELEGGNKVLRDLLTERNGLITQQAREIEVSKTSFSIVKSKVFKAFMEETQNLNSNPETCGQSSKNDNEPL